MSHSESSSSEPLDLDEIVNNEYKKRARRHRKKQRQRESNLTPIVVIQLYLKSIMNSMNNSSFIIFSIVEENMSMMIAQYIGRHFRTTYSIAIGQCGLNMSLRNAASPAAPITLYLDSMQRQHHAHRDALTNENSEFPNPAKVNLDGCGNNFALGRYSDAAYFVERQSVMQLIRRQLEQHENYLLQGIEVVHSIGGGTGSGMGCLILQELKDMYYGGKFTISSFTTFPSVRVSDIVVEPYNAVLALDGMKDSVDQVFVIDNGSLWSHAWRTSRGLPTYAHLNDIANNAMNGVRRLWNCPQSGWTARAIHSELSLRSHRCLKYFAMSQPVPSSLAYSFDWYDLMKADNYLAPLDGDGQFMKAICTLHVNQHASICKKSKKMLTKRCLKAGTRTSIEGKLHEKCRLNPTFVECESMKDDVDYSVSMIVHHTGIVNLFESILARYKKMWKRKAFFHWYRGQGMDLDEFQAAQENIENIIEQYRSV
eukprot:CAMPEP_0197072812 /NCGR_PEP_ID=MMETSP1384-20130603/210285_1 /TAXON_ID=29189 /ORGANISM="Ammonia sp." /LENGTH=481 /DNA_ID=CAMNT_0042511633 /DNA_START=967 /DNA_END=2412 /DNA_ORIENTATION=+